MHATFQHKTPLSETVWEFFVLPAADQSLDYQPGQYVHVGLPGITDARGIDRTFTLTSIPSEPLLSFAVKFPSPHTSYKAALLALKPGETVTVSQAMGDLVLPRDASRPLVFVAGGLGIASFAGMMKWFAANQQARSINLLYAARNEKDIIYRDVIAGCPGLQTNYFTAPDRLNVQTVMDAASDNALLYLSGSEPFTMGLRSDLLMHGVNPANIAYDFFDGYKPSDL